MTGELSNYGLSGQNSDRVAKDIRRLIGDGRVNVFDFMTDTQISAIKTRAGGVAADNVTSIQAAIDYAYANKVGTVIVPSGLYNINSTIYVDPPGNLRSGSTANAGWSMAFVGEDEVLGDSATSGSTFRACVDGFTPKNDFVLLQIGPGNGCLVRNINITCNRSYPWKASDMSTNGIAIAVSGSGGGGASFTVIEKCNVGGFYCGYYLGNNDGALADSNTLIKCNAGACIQGVVIGSSQAYLTHLYDCRISASYGTYTSVFPTFKVFGGSFMKTGAYLAGGWRFPIASTSTLTSYTDNSFRGLARVNYTFTSTLTTNVSPYGYDWADRLDFIYTKWALKLPNYGFVPVKLTAWNSTTKVGTFSLDAPWLYWFFNKFSDGGGPSTYCSFVDELQAATAIYASDHCVLHQGGGHIYGTHIETGCSITVMSAMGTADYRSFMRGVYFNGDQTQAGTANFYTPADREYALYAVQSAWPMFEMTGGAGIVLDGVEFAQTQAYMKSPVVVDVISHQLADSFQIRNANYYSGVLIRTDYSYSLGLNVVAAQPKTSTGHFDRPYNWPRWVMDNNSSAGWYERSAPGMVDFAGNRPDPSAMPKLLPSHVDTDMQGTIVNYTSVPIVHGGTIYQVSDPQNSNTYRYMAAAQRGTYGWTYGKDITGNWSYSGGSSVLNITTDAALALMFPGLTITLNNGVFDFDGIVVGVQRQVGYVYVFCPGYTNAQLPGTKGATYTGSTIKQKPYNVKKFGRQCEFGIAAPSSGTWIAGDIVYSTQPATTGFVGWVCTVGGSPGTWKTFGAVSP